MFHKNAIITYNFDKPHSQTTSRIESSMRVLCTLRSNTATVCKERGVASIQLRSASAAFFLHSIKTGTNGDHKGGRSIKSLSDERWD